MLCFNSNHVLKREILSKGNCRGWNSGSDVP